MRLLIATDGLLPRWDGISSFMNEIVPLIEHDFKLTIFGPNLGEFKSKYHAKLIRFPILICSFFIYIKPNFDEFRKLLRLN